MSLFHEYMKITQQILFETSEEEIKKLDDVFYRGNLMKIYSFIDKDVIYVSDDINFMEKYKGVFSPEDVRPNDFDLFYKFIEVPKNIEITKTTSDAFSGDYDFYYFNIKDLGYQGDYREVRKGIVVVTPETKKNFNLEDKNKIIQKQKNIEESVINYIKSAKMFYIATKEGGYGDQSVFFSKDDARFKRDRYIIEKIKDTKKIKIVKILIDIIVDKNNISNIEQVNNKTYTIDYKNIIDIEDVIKKIESDKNKKENRNLDMFSFEQLVIMM